MRSRTILITIAGAACCAAPVPAAAKAPVVNHLVAFKDGTVKEKRVRASAVTVKVGRRRCAAGRATPLAALVRAKPGTLGLKDFGSCSRRAADGGQLFVRSIRGVRNRGQDGWVYKVGRKLPKGGRVKVTVDGRSRVLSLRGKPKFRSVLFTSRRLAAGRHKMTVKTLGRNAVELDAVAPLP